MTRLQIYVAGSAILANIVLLRAYYERPNFYSAAVYISQSTGSLMFLINLALIITASFCYGLQRLFYGTLRPIETEQLYDKAWFAVSETLLAMTIFRDDVGVWFFIMFLTLLSGKIWQWIAEGRVEFLEQQPPANPRLFHTRLIGSLLLSVIFDIVMMNYCVDAILRVDSPGVMVMFGFEYVLLAVASISTLLRYSLTLTETLIIQRQEKARAEARRIAREQAPQPANEDTGTPEAAVEDDNEDDGDVPGWEEKGRWVFYLDLATDFIKSVVYLGFFMILMMFYGLPIHIMRDLFMTIRSFIKRVNDFVQYRNATRDMNARYLDATAEELERENTCIVCREEMRAWVQPGAEDGAQAGRRVDERHRPKKLPCGHILHFSCLRSWLERQQVCPTCRRPVLDATPSNNRPNNQVDPGQQPQQNQPGVPGVRNVLPPGIPPQPNFPPAPAGPPAQQGGQQHRPAGNMRVFNLGPVRIALGNLRIPAEQRNNANPAQQNNNPFLNLAQQLAQNQGQIHDPIPGQSQNQNQEFARLPNINLSQHPADVQADLLRIQQNIIDSIRLLNLQNDQLETIHALLAELNRLQQATGVTAATGQELPPIAPLNPQYGLYPMMPQAYFSRGPVLRQGDPGVPEGLILPEGWTLRPMALAPQLPVEGIQTAPLSGEGSTSGIMPPPRTTNSQTHANPSSSSSASGPAPGSAAPESAALESAASESFSKPAEPSSPESSWSFGNVNGHNEGEATGSAIAGSSSEGQNVARRTATVEDADDNGL